MTRPVTVRVKMDQALRCSFRLASARAHALPSKVLRLLIEEYVAVQGEATEKRAPVHEQTFRQVARRVAGKKPRSQPVLVNEDDEEQLIARMETWWSPSRAHRQKY